VKFRWRCNKSLRYALHLFAAASRAQCLWAETYYGVQRQRGKSHAAALRSLAQRWVKIIWKMWQTSTAYDGELHARNQQKHGSWVFALTTN